MTMNSIADTLKILIATAEDLVRTPQKGPTLMQSTFPELAAEIRKLDRQPAEGVRTTAAAMVMVISLEQFAQGAAHDKGSQWLMMAGAVLPILRAEAYVAMINERGMDK
jgi:hypothetical protein